MLNAEQGHNMTKAQFRQIVNSLINDGHCLLCISCLWDNGTIHCPPPPVTTPKVKGTNYNEINEILHLMGLTNQVEQYGVTELAQWRLYFCMMLGMPISTSYSIFY